MKKLSRNLVLFAFILSSSVLFMFQNCSSHSNNKSSAGNTSPFKDVKVQMATSRKISGTSAGLLPVGSKITVVVSETCLKARKPTDLVAGKRFVEKYLPADFYAQPTQSFDQYAFGISTQKEISLSDLTQAVAKDNCVLGLSDTVSGKSQSAVAGSSMYQQSDNFTAAIDLQLQNLIPSQYKVTVGVIDTGIDFNNPDTPELAADYNLGTDFSKQLVQGVIGNNPQDTAGHGTSVASVIGAKGVTNSAVVGLARRNVKVLPIKLIGKNEDPVTDYQFFQAIRRAVNGGAEIINISLGVLNSDPSIPFICSPGIGQALYYATQRGTMVVVAAGNGLKTSATSEVLVAGEVLSPADVGVLPTGFTIAPACWAKYFKGVVAVSALQTGTNTLATFSNYGKNSVEIAAPGTGVTTFGLNNTVAQLDGTSLSAPQVVAAAALTMAYHKMKNWSYSPWLIEDIVLNGSREDSVFAQAVKSVRKGRILDFSTLIAKFNQLASISDQQRRSEPTDNNTEGAGFDVDNTAGAILTSIEVYSRSPIIRNSKDRMQFEVVAYYSNGSYKAVTRDAVLVSQNSAALQVDNQGLGYPVAGFSGAVNVEANYSGKKASTSVIVTTFDTITGSDSNFTDLEIVQLDPSATDNFYGRRSGGQFSVYANYSSGLKRDISGFVSGASRSGNLVPRTFNSGRRSYLAYDVGQAFGGSKDQISAFYQGRKVTSNEFTMPLSPFNKLNISARSLSLSSGFRYDYMDGNVLIYYSGNQRTLEVAVDQSFYPLINPRYQSDDCGLVSTDIYTPIDDSKFINKTCTVQITAQYRGGGTSQSISQTFTLKVLPDRITSLTLVSRDASNNTYIGPNYKTLDLIAGTASSQTVIVKQDEINFQITNLTSAVNMQHSALKQIFSSFDKYALDIWNGVSLDNIAVDVSLKANANVKTRSQYVLQKFSNACSLFSDDLSAVVAPAVVPAANLNVSYCNPTNSALSPFAGGSGTSVDPYRICTIDQLFNVRLTQGGSFRLENNLDFASYGNIAQKSVTSVICPLSKDCSFDGQMHEMKNIQIYDTEKDYIGLFSLGNISSVWSTVQNLIISNALIGGHYNVSVLGTMPAMAKNIHLTNNIVNANGNGYGLAYNERGTGINILNSSVVNSKIYIVGNAATGLTNYSGSTDKILGLNLQVEIFRTGPPSGSDSAYGLMEYNGNNGLIANSKINVNINVSGAAAGLIGSSTNICVKNTQVSGKILSQSDQVGGMFSRTGLSVDVRDSILNLQVYGRNQIGSISGISQNAYVNFQNNQINESANPGVVSSNAGGGLIGYLDNYMANILDNKINSHVVSVDATPGLIAGIATPKINNGNTSPESFYLNKANNINQSEQNLSDFGLSGVYRNLASIDTGSNSNVAITAPNGCNVIDQKSIPFKNSKNLLINTSMESSAPAKLNVTVCSADSNSKCSQSPEVASSYMLSSLSGKYFVSAVLTSTTCKPLSFAKSYAVLNETFGQYYPNLCPDDNVNRTLLIKTYSCQ